MNNKLFENDFINAQNEHATEKSQVFVANKSHKQIVMSSYYEMLLLEKAKPVSLNYQLAKDFSVTILSFILKISTERVTLISY